MTTKWMKFANQNRKIDAIKALRETANVSHNGQRQFLPLHFAKAIVEDYMGISPDTVSLGSILEDALIAQAIEEPKHKLIHIRKGNDQYRFIEFNKPVGINKGEYSFGGSDFDIERKRPNYGIVHPAIVMHDLITKINLVTEVSIHDYELSVQIPEGFASDENEWINIMSQVETIVRNVLFKDEPVKVTNQDFRARYNNHNND